MAEALIGVVTETVLTKAISLANERISAACSVKEDLQRLAKQLEMIQSLLSDAESKSTTNKTIEVWLKELEDAATDADDLLDELAYEVLRKNILKGNKDKVRSFFSSSNPLVFRFKMVSMINKINLQMDEIFKNANRIGLRPAEIKNSPNDPRKVPLTDPFLDDSKIVGRDDDVRKLVSQLTFSKDGKDLSVIGIVAMAGQGKTALAQLLLKNDEVNKHFEKRIWTCVSDDFNLDRVLKDMLQSLTGKASELTNREAIVKKLSEELRGKRFLLVLDDVWNDDDSELWDHMNNSLQAIGSSKGSKIIVTTRNEAVTSIMNGFVYRLGVLSRKESQELFEKIAFGNGRVAKTTELVKIGERIVDRCGGVPLALKALGSLMSFQTDELEWLKIEESSIWSKLDGVRSAIKLSFDHLPSLSLKQCFAYCSSFRKDSVIERKKLIQMWMAHGLLNPSKGSNLEMEDVGNNYLKILLQRSLLQEAEFDMNGNIETCKMHDLVHDFATEASKGRCSTVEVGALTDDDIKAVHLSVVPDERESSNISEKSFPRLRTLHLSVGFSCEDFLVHCKCKHLRVLVMEDLDDLPLSIAKLKHLRYLDISRTRISALPGFISKLYNLQTLRLPHLPDLPKNFCRLVSLRHLHIHEGKYYFFPFQHRPHLVAGIGQLTSLRTLNCYTVSRDKGYQIEELGSLNHLEGSIRIAGLENVTNGDDARRAKLSGKRNIESLQLFWNPIDGSHDQSVLEGLEPHPCLKTLRIVHFNGRSLPSWVLLLRNLTKIQLEYLTNCEEIPSLGHLPCLKVVHVRGMNSVRSVGNDWYGWTNLVSAHSSQASAVVFPSLKEVTFYGMPCLEEWSDAVQPSFVSSVEVFPCLEKLAVRFCPKINRFPAFLDKIFSLRYLEFTGCDNLSRLPENLSGCTGLLSLSIRDCHKLVSIPDLSSLHSLKSLCICGCGELLALPRGIEACRSLCDMQIPGPASLLEILPHHLTNLRSLTLELSENIDHCIPMEPNSNAEDDPFSTLENLFLIGMPEIKSLPEQIRRFTALTFLSLKNFDGLETVPEWFGNFRFRQDPGLMDCNYLENFPSVEGMQGLANSRRLAIFYRPNWTKRCEKGGG